MNTTPPRRVVDCYSFLDLFARFGVSDFTEGIYPSPETSYETAQELQANYLLDQINCEEGSLILDVGCGNGRVLRAAKKRGAFPIGITISPEQARKNNAAGLRTELMDYRDIPDEWLARFDGIVANGSIEHFAQLEDVIAGQQSDIYRNMFKIFSRILKPNGKLATTVIHFRLWVDPYEIVKGPKAFKRGTADFHSARLVADFGGFYPTRHQLVECASKHFYHLTRVDGTRDYELTSEHWLREWMKIMLKPTAWWHLGKKFMKNPGHTCGFIDDLLISQSWLKQFKDWHGQGTPVQLFRDTWQKKEDGD